MHNKPIAFILFLTIFSCTNKTPEVTIPHAPFVWENANMYFLLTDRFMNADPTNDINFERNKPTGEWRGFMGGDFKGITQKIKEGYFTDLGINALWFSPIAEQGHGITDEGTGPTYGYHGYWAKDWTSIDPNWGSEEEFALLVQTAHDKGIRVLMDIVINHTTPGTSKDPDWGDDWVRMQPTCTYESYDSYVKCTLVDNLPDIKTESNSEVSLPAALREKWEREGRLDKELNELDTFFNANNYPRAPRYYIIKWLTDFVKKYGVDGFRIDTAKHTDASLWNDLWKEAYKAFEEWKVNNPSLVLDENPFFMVGEVYNYNISHGRNFDNGGVWVDYYAENIKSLINFEFKSDAKNDYETIFAKYATILHTELEGQSVLNYLTSHDDGSPFDEERKMAFEAATKLLLTPGASQIYYGDETNRILKNDVAVGDAKLRSFMNWDELAQNTITNGVGANDLFQHYAKLGAFRIHNPSVGAGIHQKILDTPYTFKREYTKGEYKNKVVVVLDAVPGEVIVNVKGIFEEGMVLNDYYSNQNVKVKNGQIVLSTTYSIVLLGV